MRKLTIILLILISLNATAKKCNHILKGKPYAWLKAIFPPPVDYWNLPYWYRTSGPETGDINVNGTSQFTTAFGSTTLSGYRFSNKTTSNFNFGHALWLSNCVGVIIENCWFDDSVGLGIYVSGGSDITIRNCFFSHLKRGFLGEGTTGDLVVYRNQFLNMIWDRDDVGCCEGQVIQTRAFVSGSGNIIRANRAVNYFGESYNEDLINVNQSGGTSGSHMLIDSNILVGGGPSISSGGIICGDAGGDYVDFTANLLVDPGQYGFGVVGGDGHVLTGNKAYSIQKPWNGTAYQVFNCSSTTVGTSNYANWTCGGPNGAGGIHPSCGAAGANNNWQSGSCGSPTAPSTGQTLASMGIPDPVIDFLTADQIWQLRALKIDSARIVINGAADHGDGADPIDLKRPHANAGVDQTISISTATLNALSTGQSSLALSEGSMGTNTIAGYRWVQVSGPNTATMSASTSSTNNLSAMITGTYVFRLEITQNNVQFGEDTYDADWVTITATVTATGVKMPVKVNN